MIISPVKSGFKVTQWFGENPDIYSQFSMDGHNGLDIATPMGTDLYASIDGKVKVGFDADGYGHYVRITERHGEKRRQVILAHLSETLVEDEQDVKAGDKVGKSGSSGFSTGAHLHFGYRMVNADGSIEEYENGYYGYQDIFGKGWLLKHDPSEY